jgi:hypothetical protein
VAHGGWWASAEGLGRRGYSWLGPERLHRIGDEEGIVHRRHGGALGHLDPI